MRRVHDASSPGDEFALEGGRGIPVASMVESIVGCKWSVRLLGLLADGPSRPSALLRACPGLSAKVMNERLRKMTRLGVVRRTVFGDRLPVEIEYVLTPFGCRFMGILDEVRRLQEAVDSGALSGSGRIRALQAPFAEAAERLDAIQGSIGARRRSSSPKSAWT
jgi:DNA-binding HxlR family transcriptional regulator